MNASPPPVVPEEPLLPEALVELPELVVPVEPEPVEPAPLLLEELVPLLLLVLEDPLPLPAPDDAVDDEADVEVDVDVGPVEEPVATELELPDVLVAEDEVLPPQPLSSPKTTRAENRIELKRCMRAPPRAQATEFAAFSFCSVRGPI